MNAYTRSMLLRVQIVRVFSAALQGRLLIAACDDTESDGARVRQASRCARRLERERVGYASAYALLLRAGIARCDPAGRPERAVAPLRAAAAAANQNDLASCVAAANYQLGRILGGDEGGVLIQQAQDWLRTQADVVKPHSFFAMLAPGFERE